MTKKQDQTLKHVQSVLQRNFQQSLLSVVYVDEKDGNKKKILTMDGTANDTQAEHLARSTLSNVEIQTRGMIVTLFDQPLPKPSVEPRFSKKYEDKPKSSRAKG